MEHHTPSNSCIEPSLFAKLYLNDWTHQAYVRVVFTCLYSIIFVVALTGNLLVIVSVCTRKNLQSVRNTFIVSLSCSDLAVCLTSLPITPVYCFMKVWILGKAMCHFLPLIQGMSVSISSFTLTSIAIDRYILIVHPTKPPITMPYAISMILFTWLVAASLCAPLSYFSVYEYKEDNPSTVRSAPNFCGYFCFEKWPSDDAKRIYGTSVLIVQFLIPLLIISISYANIYLKLKTSINAKHRRSIYARNIEYQQQYNLPSSARQGSSQDDSRRSSSAVILSGDASLNERQKLILRRQQRTNRMLICMVVIFGACLFWQVAYNCLVDYELLPQWLAGQPYFFGLAVHSVAMSCTAWNPVLYAGFNDSFRKSFLEILRPLLCFCRKKSAGNIDQPKKLNKKRGSSKREKQKRLYIGENTHNNGKVKHCSNEQHLNLEPTRNEGCILVTPATPTILPEEDEILC